VIGSTVPEAGTTFSKSEILSAFCATFVNKSPQETGESTLNDSSV
jgi:hypothetical protein